MGKPLRQQNETNNYFLLQCMAGITVAALTAAAIAALAIIAYGTSAATTAGLAATNMMFASSLMAASSPVLPMLFIGAIGFVFLLALLNGCGDNNTTVRVVDNRPSFWGNRGYWGGSNVHVHHTGYPSGRMHHHDGHSHHHGTHVEVPNGPLNGFPPLGGNVHHHNPGSNMHGHFSTGHPAHHGGGARVEVHNNHGTTHGHGF
ncbi:hypothetical protein ACD661_04610 [Legionella lytica]|uniref:Transmembrane protein n=1 Tax=Legionella lytica TaxID=96232 RepID=A0ABW8D556_9GAMM